MVTTVSDRIRGTSSQCAIVLQKVRKNLSCELLFYWHKFQGLPFLLRLLDAQSRHPFRPMSWLLLPDSGVRAASVLWSQRLVLVKQQLSDPQSFAAAVPPSTHSIALVAGLVCSPHSPRPPDPSAIVLRPATLLSLHQARRNRKYRRLFSSQRGGKPGPKGPSKELIEAVVQMKQRNPAWAVRASLSRYLGF